VFPILRLDDQMHVRGLDREVHDAEPILLAALLDHAVQRPVLLVSPHRGQARLESYGDMRRRLPREHRPLLVLHAATTLASRSLPTPTPTVGELERQLLLLLASQT
jgi:hypothetical protein